MKRGFIPRFKNFRLLRRGFRPACFDNPVPSRFRGRAGEIWRAFVRRRSQESGVRSQELGGRRQEAGGRSQELGVRRQEAGDAIKNKIAINFPKNLFILYGSSF
ncbi:hypothetical protein V0288_15800 [Pannus brasiliensis CCIBt3594]|uniref:Uncharacterized protein n=1 Tax=Pannus brasiliensis CCIBt3594 TaxID=1427578 RepID=A0AAW9QUH8_9CHRO